jgi:hypothetical protein
MARPLYYLKQQSSLSLCCRHKPIATRDRRHLQMQRRMFRMPALIQHRLIGLLARMDRHQNLRRVMLTEMTAQAALPIMNLNCLHSAPPSAHIVWDSQDTSGVAFPSTILFAGNPHDYRVICDSIGRQFSLHRPTSTCPDAYRRTSPSTHRLPSTPATPDYSRTHAAAPRTPPAAHPRRRADMPDAESSSHSTADRARS